VNDGLLNRQANVIETVFRQWGVYTRVMGGRVYPDLVEHHLGWLTAIKAYQRRDIEADLKRVLGACNLVVFNGTVMVQVRHNAHLETWTPALLRPLGPGESRRNESGGDER